jgi:hypothetical protein
MATRASRPNWFLPLSIVLILWGLLGCVACFAQVVLGTVPGATPEDVALVRAMPAWFNLVYVVATLGALAGAIALVLRLALAGLLFTVTLIAIVVQFGYVFAATDTLARKGAAAAIFPLAIFAIGAAEVALANMARRRGWIG